MKSHAPLFLLLLLTLSVGCTFTASEQQRVALTATYATGYAVTPCEGYTQVDVHDPWDTTQLIQRYILVHRDSLLPQPLPSGTLVRVPLSRVVAYNASHCSQLIYLGVDSTLVGVCEPQYIHQPHVTSRVANGEIVDLGESAAPNMERLLDLAPEAIFTTPYKNMNYGAVAQCGIPLIETIDYMEQSPLGATEWVRFMSLFFDQQPLADSLFTATATRYNTLREEAKQATTKPTLLAELMYGGVWYLPGGASYMATLFADAGASYLWQENKSTGALPLSFESVFDKAEEADYWLVKYNKPTDMNYASLAAESPLYSQFRAYKEQSIYACNTNNIRFYEETPLHPDYLLADLIAIFHPHLVEQPYTPRYFTPLQP